MTYNELLNTVKGYTIDQLTYGGMNPDCFAVCITAEQFTELLSVMGTTFGRNGSDVIEKALPGGMLDDIDDGFAAGLGAKPFGWWFMWATTDRF